MTIQRDMSTGLVAGSANLGFLQYKGTSVVAGTLNGSATVPTNTTRLNYEGNFYANTFYGDGTGLTGTAASLTAGVASSANAIADGVVSTTAKLANSVVTYAKIQNMTTARILGRTTAAAGVVEEISVGTGLSMAAGVLSCTVTGGVTTFEGRSGAVTLQAGDLTPSGYTAGTIYTNVVWVDPPSIGAITTYTKILSLRMPISGTGRFFMRVTGGSDTCYFKLYKNDVAVGTERTGSSAGYSSSTQDLAFVAGDIMQVYAKSYSGVGGGSVRGFSVGFSQDGCPALSAITSATTDGRTLA